MSILERLRLKTKKTLIQAYGPAELDEGHDPVVQTDKDLKHEEAHDQQESGEQGDGRS